MFIWHLEIWNFDHARSYETCFPNESLIFYLLGKFCNADSAQLTQLTSFVSKQDPNYSYRSCVEYLSQASSDTKSKIRLYSLFCSVLS